MPKKDPLVAVKPALFDALKRSKEFDAELNVIANQLRAQLLAPPGNNVKRIMSANLMALGKGQVTFEGRVVGYHSIANPTPTGIVMPPASAGFTFSGSTAASAGWTLTWSPAASPYVTTDELVLSRPATPLVPAVTVSFAVQSIVRDLSQIDILTGPLFTVLMRGRGSAPVGVADSEVGASEFLLRMAVSEQIP